MAHLALAASVLCFASTISFGALAGDRLGMHSQGWKEYLAFGPVQVVRYAVAVAMGIAVVVAAGGRRTGPALARPARKQLRRFTLRLVLPQVVASGLLYLAFVYGDPAIAGATLFSSAFLSLAHSRLVGLVPRLGPGKSLAVAALLCGYLGGLALFVLGGDEIADSVTSDEIAKAIFLAFLAAIALTVYLSSVGEPYTTHSGSPLPKRDQAIAVSVGVLGVSVVVALLWLLVPGTTSPTSWMPRWSTWTTLWPIVLLGISTFWANAFMLIAAQRKDPDDVLEPEPTTRTLRAAALTWEPLVVIAAALAFTPLRAQIPDDWSDRLTEIVGCVLMAVGATGAAVVTGRASPKPNQPVIEPSGP